MLTSPHSDSQSYWDSMFTLGRYVTFVRGWINIHALLMDIYVAQHWATLFVLYICDKFTSLREKKCRFTLLVRTKDSDEDFYLKMQFVSDYTY